MIQSMSSQESMTHPFQSLPQMVSESALIQALTTKVSYIVNSPFDYAGELCRLYKEVKPEIARMAILFPEYTPHDTDLHIDRLFVLAETLFGKEFFAALDCNELFLLCTGLIAHDWGMALGDAEINALVEGGSLAESKQEGFMLLDDEQSQLTSYIAEKRLPLEGVRCPALTQTDAALPNDEPAVIADVRYAMQCSPLPEYIRRTHAWRSGARLRKRWGKEFPALADAAAAVCIGHWLDLAKLETQSPFLAPRPLFGSLTPPNLRAVTIVVRLTDLFDIGIDRTPHAVWRYINPHDVVSRREWEKHRCLDAVVTECDSLGQIAPVLSGKVHDHEVWAAILDLQRYCDEQLRGCGDIMRRHLHADSLQRGHSLPWKLRSEVIFRVEPIGFKPLNVRFEFDRQNILQMLGSLLYQGDPYVFLRELLQNAIDATRLRRARHLCQQECDPTSRPPRGIIYFDVKHDPEGDAVITCRDSGIGMDEITVKNYMAKAGASFWQSDQFQNMNSGFTPIGRFGIGLLSCFSVAEEIEVLTRRYDWPDPKSDPLKIHIPNVAHQFRIEQAPDSTPFGTSITVYVKGSKLRELWSIRHAVEAAKMAQEKHPIQPLKVTDYLKRIAGFVRFPIVVDENGVRTVIVHPDYEKLPETEDDGNSLLLLEREAKKRGLHTQVICRLSRNYDWSIGHRTRPNARRKRLLNNQEILGQRVVDLISDLGHEMAALGRFGMEGWLSHADLVNQDMVFDSIRSMCASSPFSGKTIDFQSLENDSRSHEDYDELTPDSDKLESPSSRMSIKCRVFRDGLLVPSIVEPTVPNSWRGSYGDFEMFIDGYNAQMVLNLPANSSTKLDPSRLQIIGIDRDWADFIYEARNSWILRTGIIDSILVSTSSPNQESLKRRFFELGRLVQLYDLDHEWLGRNVPKGEFPVPCMSPNGNFSFVLARELGSGPHWIAPSKSAFDPNWVWCNPNYHYHQNDVLRRKLISQQNTWLPALSAGSGSVANSAWGACSWHLDLRNCVQESQWLVPPTDWSDPILQKGYLLCSRKLDFRRVALDLQAEPTSVSSDDQQQFFQEIKRILKAKHKWIVFLPFKDPFKDKFCVTNIALNSLHSSVQWFMRALACLYLNGVWSDSPIQGDESWAYLVTEIFDSHPLVDSGPEFAACWKAFWLAMDASGYLPGHKAIPSPIKDDFYLPQFVPDVGRPDYDTQDSDAYDYPDHEWGYALPANWKPGEIISVPKAL